MPPYAAARYAAAAYCCHGCHTPLRCADADDTLLFADAIMITLSRLAPPRLPFVMPSPILLRRLPLIFFADLSRACYIFADAAAAF